MFWRPKHCATSVDLFDHSLFESVCVCLGALVLYAEDIAVKQLGTLKKVKAGGYLEK